MGQDWDARQLAGLPHGLGNCELRDGLIHVYRLACDDLVAAGTFTRIPQKCL